MATATLAEPISVSVPYIAKALSKKSRILEIDGLRTFAIAAVMLLHFNHSSNSFELGWAGVDLFFVISGFLITGILLNLRSDPTPYRKFYWRRVVRIFPPYYTVLAIIAVLIFVQHEGFDRLEWLRCLFFLPAINHGISLHVIFGHLFGHQAFNMSRSQFAPVLFARYKEGLGVYWSLAVEELFYLLWAPIVLKGSKRLIVTFAVAPIFLCPILRGLTHVGPLETEYLGFITRFDTLAIGACVAIFLRSRPTFAGWKLMTPIVPLSAILLWLCVHCGIFQGVNVCSTESFSIFGYSLIALIFGCLVAGCVQLEGHRALSLLRLKPVVYLGTISYTMYLTHSVIYVSMVRIFASDLLRGLSCATLTIFTAALSWKYFESPILKWKQLSGHPSVYKSATY